MFRLLPAILFMAFSTGAAAQVLESKVFSAIERSGFDISFERRVETGDTVRFENVIMLDPKEGRGISIDWVAESVAGDIAEITVSPDGSLFNRTLGDDTQVASLDFVNVISRITGDVSDREVLIKGDSIGVTLAAFGELANGLFSINGIDIRSAATREEQVATQTEARIDLVSLGLSGNGSEWETVTVRIEDIEVAQAGEMSQALSEQMQSETKVDDVNLLLEMLSAAFSGTASIGQGTLFVHGTDAKENPIDVKAGFSDYRGRIQFVSDKDLEVGVAATLGRFDANVLSEPAQFEVRAADYDVAFDLSLGADDIRTLAARLAEGKDPEPSDFSSLSVDARIGVGGSETSGRFDEGGVTGTFSLVSEEASERIKFRKGVLDLDIDSGGFEARGLLPDVSEDEMTLSSEGLGMRFQIPMIPGEAEAEQSLEVAMAARELLAGDAIWNLFDPEARIDREPVNVDIDVTMRGRLLEPLTDESQELFDVFDPDSVEIRSYAISGGGAEIRATGETTLDMAEDIPAGEGKIFVTLKGVTTLMGHLVDLGIAPPEANMGLLGGLGAFSTQVEPDHYQTEIEFFPDGRITTNGRPVPLGR